MRIAIAAVLALAPLVTACGPNCQSTCQRIYSSTDDGCNIAVPGRDAEDSIRDCIDSCEGALETPGQIGDYDPNTRNTSGETVVLENEKQAALWMDCVEAADCSALDDGYCAPI